MFSALKKNVCQGKERKKIASFQLPHVGVGRKMAQKRDKEGGTHDEEINVQREKEGGKKSLIPYQNTGSNLAALFYSNYVREQLPYAGHKQGFAVAGWLNHRAYSLGLLTWLCGSTLYPILKRNKFCHF